MKDEQEIDFTLRDYYAGLAMQEYIRQILTPEAIVRESFCIADAMIKYRNNQ